MFNLLFPETDPVVRCPMGLDEEEELPPATVLRLSPLVPATVSKTDPDLEFEFDAVAASGTVAGRFAAAFAEAEP